ncbi:uncharacterized protein LOC117174283 [Belonocnema kinseyi]|uniref:uncharacterized protein LOC117174283 n=1 Tax=Belonocnema kinseyi TaxID=2817044 RepID=UPI00143D6748|nr:uncharacterized protein LOC117174283 [Belonocnema kinseyi]
MDSTNKCRLCNNAMREPNIIEHFKLCKALQRLILRRAGMPEEVLKYHPHRDVRQMFRNEMAQAESQRIIEKAEQELTRMTEQRLLRVKVHYRRTEDEEREGNKQ